MSDRFVFGSREPGGETVGIARHCEVMLAEATGPAHLRLDNYQSFEQEQRLFGNGEFLQIRQRFCDGSNRERFRARHGGSIYSERRCSARPSF